MVRRIGFDDTEEASGAVRRRGQRWRADRRVETHGHAPMTPEARARRVAQKYDKQAEVKSAKNGEPAGFGRILRNPIVLIVGFLLFNVFFIAFLILRAIWLARHRRGVMMDV
jgi:hypothetical protein